MSGLLTIGDLSKKEIEHIFDRASDIKNNPNKYRNALNNRVIGLYYQRESTRSRFAFESGILRMGGASIFFKTPELQLSRGESIYHTARSLSCYLDALVVRALSHQDVEDFANFGSIPVINSMSGMYIPLVALTVGFTVKELLDDANKLSFVYIGDGYNTCHSLMLYCSKMGIPLTVITPEGYEPNPVVVDICNIFNKDSGGSLSITNDIEYVEGADIIVTDVWVSIGMEDEREKRIMDFKGYTVNRKLIEKTGKSNVLIFHPMPLRIGEEVCSDVVDLILLENYSKNLMYISQSVLVNIFSKEEE